MMITRQEMIREAPKDPYGASLKPLTKYDILITVIETAVYFYAVIPETYHRPTWPA